MTTDWVDWHRKYDDPTSSLRGRLEVVRGYLDDWLGQAPRPARVLSLCAGDGRDLIEVLARGDADQVSAVTVELDPRLTTRATAAASAAGLGEVIDVRGGDASDPAVWADAVPADLVLLAGIFGNVSDGDIRRTVGALPMMCAPGSWVVWTRHRKEPDLTPSIRSWLSEVGFDEVGFTGSDIFGVGAHRFAGARERWDPPDRLFTFFR